MIKPLVVVGSGGHASVLVDILRQQQREIIGIVSPEMDSNRRVFEGIPAYLRDDDILQFATKSIKLVNGIGSLPKNNLRAVIFDKFTALGYEFETIIASSATVSALASLAKGCQVFPGAIIQVGARIGENTIINTGTIVEHDCRIGSNNHLAPGVTLSGEVETDSGVHIGTGASIIQAVLIEKNVVIGAGAVVTKNVVANSVLYPAKGIIQKV